MTQQRWFYTIQELYIPEELDNRQYHEISMKLEDLGRQGWEAVGPLVPGAPGLRSRVILLFKRPADTDENAKDGKADVGR